MRLAHARVRETRDTAARPRVTGPSGPGRHRRLILTAAAVLGALLVSAGGMAAPAWGAPARTASPAAARVAPAAQVAGEPAFGPNVYVFGPGMRQSRIETTVNSIARRQARNQFGTQRYALLFEPGTYGSGSSCALAAISR